MKKVLIISYSFPPLNNIASRRFSEISPYFYDLGWEPYILTTHSHGDLVSKIPEEYVFRIANHPQRSTLRQNGVGTQNCFTKVRRKLGFTLRSFDSTYNTWYVPVITNNTVEKLRKLGFDFIIASYGPSAALLIGSKLSKELNVPWLADFRDLGALHQDKFLKKNIAIKLLDRLHENRVIKSASMLTTVSIALADELKESYDKKTAVIYNGWVERTSLITGFEEEAFECDKPYIFYAGRFYEHQMPAIFSLLEAIKDEQLILVIRSLGPAHLEQEIIDHAKSKKMLYQLKLLPPAKASVIDREQANSKINLVVEDFDKTYKFKKGVLTGKLMQLLTYTAPILAIARDDSEIGDVLTKSNKGMLASTVREIKEFIRKVHDEDSFCSIDLGCIDPYSKKMQAAKLVRLMDEKIENRNV